MMPSTAPRSIYEEQISSLVAAYTHQPEPMVDHHPASLLDDDDDEAESSMYRTRAPFFDHEAPRQSLASTTIASTLSQKHNDTGSAQMSASTESSPTTTLSTMDSSPLSEASPSSSPDTPYNLIPLHMYPASTFGFPLNASLVEPGIAGAKQPDRPMTSPAPRRPRNLKGLFIQPPAAASRNPVTLKTEPSSPSFIKPTVAVMKRKPSQLSLRTATSDLRAGAMLDVPASPCMPPILQRRALKHSTSSPHMLAALKTNATANASSAFNGPKVWERNASGLSDVLRPRKLSKDMEVDVDEPIPEEDSPIKTQLAQRADYETCHGSADNEEQKSPAYPDGPVAIYDDNVYLYLEPTLEEASRFDVVINVAREVDCPLVGGVTAPTAALSSGTQLPQAKKASSALAYDAGLFGNGVVDSAMSAPPFDARAPETPTTPKPPAPRNPEYIHVPWDHNTDITPDLMSLCQTIEDRTKRGKKVLIHCQQGASRSASLIIAYGLYRNPGMSVNDAYYAAQAKSRWISPNMKLMYSLQDFHKELCRLRAAPTPAQRPWTGTGRASAKHTPSMSADASGDAAKNPRTAPILHHGPHESGNSFGGRRRSRSASGSISHSTLLPSSPSLSSSFSSSSSSSSSASSTRSPALPLAAPFWGPLPSGKAVSIRMQLDATSPTPGSESPLSPRTSFVGVKAAQALNPHALAPVGGYLSTPNRPRSAGPDTSVERTLTLTPAFPSHEALVSPRAEAMTSNPLRGQVAGMRFVESPPTPARDLFSPRQTVFPVDPFSTCGPMTGIESTNPPQMADPRSPPTIGEAPIFRSIDDIF